MYAEIVNKREVDSRVSDGIHVRLVWFQRTNQVAVEVDDTKTGEAFTVEVGPNERALEVFHHPYAYAGLRARKTRPAALLAA